MHLAFVDTHGIDGTISTDWSVEYDGLDADAVVSLVDQAKDSEAATLRDLQELSIELFDECDLRAVEIVRDDP